MSSEPKPIALRQSLISIGEETRIALEHLDEAIASSPQLDPEQPEQAKIAPQRETANQVRVLVVFFQNVLYSIPNKSENVQILYLSSYVTVSWW